jgi:hypothetical protein
MNQISGSDQTIIRYLLNELSEEDQARFEEAYLSDGGLFEQVRALEEELIENYVKGDLSGRERRRFERHYLASDQRRARIEAARELVRLCLLKSSTKTATDNSIWGKFFSLLLHLRSLANWRPAQFFGVAAALLSLVVGGLVIEQQRRRAQSAMAGAEFAEVVRRAEEAERRLIHEREQLAKERKQNIELREKLENLYRQLARLELAQAGSQAPKNQVVFLALAPGVRSIINPDRPDRAVIYPNTSFVELRLELEERESTPPRSYRAVVKTVDGDREIWTQEGIKPRRRNSALYVIVRAPADRFKAAGAQDFMLTLDALIAGGKGYEELESYYFQVTASRR